MRPENEKRLNKFKKISGFLRWPCALFMLLSAPITWYFATGPIFRHTRYWGIGVAWYDYFGINFKVYSLTAVERGAAAVLFALYWGAALACAFQLFRLLGLYSRGEIFTQRSAAQMRRWGMACVGWGLTKLCFNFVPLVMANVQVTRRFDPSLVLNGLIIIAISWAIDMATEIREENELTV
jgi:hypothetical protein